MRFFFIMLSCLAFATTTFAQENKPECLESAHAVWERDLYIDVAEGASLFSRLPSMRQGELHLSPVYVNYALSTSDILQAAHMQFYFRLPEGQNISWPYTIFAIEIKVGNDGDGDQFIKFIDYTVDCNFGASVDVDRGYKIPNIKIPPHADGSRRGVEHVYIKIWGQHS